MLIYSLSSFSNIVASLCFISKGVEIFWSEINVGIIFWVFFIAKSVFFPDLPYHKTAGQASSCSGSVIPVPRQVIHSQLQPFLYAWNISVEKSLQLRSSNQRMSWMFKLFWGMKRRGMCLFWFRNLLYLDGLPTALEKFHVLSSLPPDWHKLFGIAGLLLPISAKTGQRGKWTGLFSEQVIAG